MLAFNASSHITHYPSSDGKSLVSWDFGQDSTIQRKQPHPQQSASKQRNGEVEESRVDDGEEEAPVADEWLEDRRTSVLRADDPSACDENRSSDIPKVKRAEG